MGAGRQIITSVVLIALVCMILGFILQDSGVTDDLITEFLKRRGYRFETGRFSTLQTYAFTVFRISGRAATDRDAVRRAWQIRVISIAGVPLVTYDGELHWLLDMPF